MKCSAKSCENKSHSRLEGISFHKFPRDTKLRSKWLAALEIQERDITNKSVVCSNHFLSKDLFCFATRTVLGIEAIPCLVLHENRTCSELKDPELDDTPKNSAN